MQEHNKLPFWAGEAQDWVQWGASSVAIGKLFNKTYAIVPCLSAIYETSLGLADFGICLT